MGGDEPPEQRDDGLLEVLLEVHAQHLELGPLQGLLHRRWRLLGRLLATEGSRVVSVSSMAHRGGKIDFEDLQWEHKRYRKAASYGQSKLAWETAEQAPVIATQPAGHHLMDRRRPRNRATP